MGSLAQGVVDGVGDGASRAVRIPKGLKGAAENDLMLSDGDKSIPQGLKPMHSMDLNGTTEVVP